jgi:Na+/glutamate symporter
VAKLTEFLREQARRQQEDEDRRQADMAAYQMEVARQQRQKQNQELIEAIAAIAFLVAVAYALSRTNPTS